MSYDIDLTDPVTGEVLELEEVHHVRGGTYRMGGTTQRSPRREQAPVRKEEEGDPMTSRDFAYWLQGFFEINFDSEPGAAPEGLTPAQVMSIRKHLALVFKHEIDPSYGGPAHQAELNEIHHDLPIPPAVQVKLDELKKEIDEKMAQMKQLAVASRPPGGGLMRC